MATSPLISVHSKQTIRRIKLSLRPQFILFFYSNEMSVKHYYTVYVVLTSGGNRIYGLVQPFNPSLRRGTAGKNHGRLPRPVSLVRGRQAQAVSTMDQTGRH